MNLNYAPDIAFAPPLIEFPRNSYRCRVRLTSTSAKNARPEHNSPREACATRIIIFAFLILPLMAYHYFFKRQQQKTKVVFFIREKFLHFSITTNGIPRGLPSLVALAEGVDWPQFALTKTLLHFGNSNHSCCKLQPLDLQHKRLIYFA